VSHVKAAVLRTAGTNCDVETVYALRQAGAEVDSLHVNRLAGGDASLRDYRILVLPGGFTYGDDISAGKVLANELRCRVGDEIRDFVQRDTLVLGICNGFQVLVKMGLLPGWEPRHSGVTITYNDSNRFEDRWVHLKVTATGTPFLRSEEIFDLPVAHGEGKFVCGGDETLSKLEQKGQIVVKYCDSDGSDAPYPYNPNGSTAGIAGICSASGRVFGLMPHPERNVEPYHHPGWTRRTTAAEGAGMRIFRNAVDYFN